VRAPRRVVARFGVHPPEGDEVAAEEVAQGVRVRVPPRAEHRHAVVRRPVGGAPVGEQVVEVRVQVLVGRVPGLREVVVDAHLVDRPDRRVGVGVRGEQHAPRVGRPLGGPREELDARHPRHALVGEQERDRVATLGDPREQVERLAAALARSTRYSAP
jgi:hypothetical protein